VSVFLRWGVFGILGFAAILYAYNASKRIAARHAAQPAVVNVSAAPNAAASTPAAAAAVAVPPHCEVELLVARRALEMRAQGEPIDRLLRIQEIAWQEPQGRRDRLTQVATKWFNLQGPLPAPESLRTAVLSDCSRANPAP
jgi:hypothetical protein